MNPPAVGRHLLDHPYVLISWVTRQRLRAADEREAAGDAPLCALRDQVASSRSAHGSWDITVGAWSGTIFDQRAHSTSRHLAGLAPCTMKSVSRGRVELRSADPSVLPSVEHGFLTDPDGADLAILIDGVELCRTIADTRAWRYWCEAENAPGPDVRSSELGTWVRANVGGSYHPCGTARMGRASDPGAVVNSLGRVHGVDALVVADASIFPSIPAANIHLSVLAAAERIAAELAR